MYGWKVLASIELFKTAFFRLRSDRCQLPDGRVMPNYYVMEFTDWVNIVPITSEGQVLAIKQYRHGSGRVHLEVPGGTLDPRFPEDPEVAGQRELLEETGYTSTRWIKCGVHFPNPALQSNRLHTYLALDCLKVSEPHLDPFEDLALEPFALSELQKKLEDGEFSHSLIMASVILALPKLRELGLL
jgi:8-oxo-dGTP pyrophosphatase MutT (NUDIX family)